MSFVAGNARVRALVLVTLFAVVAFFAGYGFTRLARGDDALPVAALPSRPAVPAVLPAATAAPSAEGSVAPGIPPSAAGVQRALATVTSLGGFGGRLLARVVDAQTGAVLYDRAGATPAAPASTAKLLTAAAVLAVHLPTYRFVTKVVDAGSGTVVLVGGGDPTLSAAPRGTAPLYPDAARMTDLVAQIRRADVPVQRILVDGSLFAGPSVSPAWDAADMGTGYGAPITALAADGARPSPQSAARSGVQPDLDAAHEFATLLGSPGLPVARGPVPAGAHVIASVRSAPLSVLVDQMLQDSDNVIAEFLARQVAVAEHVTASFRGAAAAIRTVLARFGVPVGSGMKDGSGLAAADRVSPAALVAVLRLVSGAAGGAKAAQLHVVTGALPVAGWSGTLQNRYTTGPPAAAAGRVRAKTGTLSGVSSLAGFVHDRSGRLLIFSLDADRAVSTVAADAALDRVVAALAACGCRH